MNIELAKLIKTVRGLREDIDGLSTPQLGHSSLEDAAITSYTGDQLAARFGKQYDGTSGVAVLSGPTPPTPIWTAETGEPGAPVIGGLKFRWEGQWRQTEADAAAGRPTVAPMDFIRVELHTAASPPAAADASNFATMRASSSSPRGGDFFAMPTGDFDEPVYAWLVARAASGMASAPSEAIGPFYPGKIKPEQLSFDLSNVGGTTIFYGAAGDPKPAAPLVGDLLITQIDNDPPKYTTERWNGTIWQLVVDQGIGEAAAAAIAAQQAADLAAQLFTQPNEPTGLGAGDKAIWIDTDAGNRTKTWSGTAWVDRLLGSGSIQPNSLVARDVMATGTVSAALLETLMVLTNTLVVGDPLGDRVSISGVNATGVTPAGIGIQQVTGGEVTFNLAPGGSPYFAGTLTGSSANYQEARVGWRIGEDGDAAFQRMNIFESLSAETVGASKITLAGQDMQNLLNARPAGLVNIGFNSNLLLQGYVNDKGIAEIGFLAIPGRGYKVEINGPIFAADNPDTAIGFDMRYTTDWSAPNVYSPTAAFLGEMFCGPNSLGQFARRVLQAGFVWYPPIVNNTPTPIRLLLTFRRAWGSGTVGVDCRNAGRLQVAIHDAGPALPNSMVANGSEAPQPAPINNSPVLPPPPPPPAPAPQSYTDTFYTTWGASYRSDGSVWSINEQGWAYQGNDGYNGDQLGLVGFNLGVVRGALAGATIKSATFYARAGHTYAVAGGKMLLGSHGADTIPPNRGSIPALKERRASVDIDRGDWAAVECLGVMQEIQASQASGFAFGRAGTLDRYYQSYFYQYPHPDCPRVVVTYEK